MYLCRPHLPDLGCIDFDPTVPFSRAVYPFYEHGSIDPKEVYPLSPCRLTVLLLKEIGLEWEGENLQSQWQSNRQIRHDVPSPRLRSDRAFRLLAASAR